MGDAANKLLVNGEMEEIRLTEFVRMLATSRFMVRNET